MSNIGPQVKALFDQCLGYPEQQQMAFVAASDYPEAVKQKVLALLKHQNTDINISELILDAVKNKLVIEDLKAGDQFNEYELVKRIGQGGQGDVWLAKRVDGQFEQQVAIKILKPIYQQKEEQRFLAERALLAQLSHPNIAQLITGGMYSDDRHYMVLEWIDGTDVIAYTKQNKLSLKQRLRLFIQICEAVAYAHQNGIIHRDIKPSNVLVDNNAVAKLLDFGVAKSKNVNLTETQHDQMLTMAYASPEQLKGDKVSTISDVYSLGLLLYELLTNQPAHQINNSSPAQLIESVTTQMPMAPSERLANDEKKSLSTKIDKELDYLVLMALRKEPERRYQTVNDLKQDVINYLDHKPLMAGGDSWWYRSKKFLLRNPLATAMAILLLAAVLFLQISLVNFNRQLAVQRDQAVTAQTQAEHQAELANKTRDFLLNILEAASPLGTKGQDIKLQDVLAIGEKQIVHSLNNKPETKTELLKTFGSIQHNLGDYSAAYSYYESAYDLAKTHDFFEKAMMAQVKMALNAAWMSDYELARKNLNEGDKLLAKVNTFEQIAWYQIEKVTVVTEIGQREEGLALAKEVLAEVKQAGVTDPELMGRIHHELGICYIQYDNEQSHLHLSQALQLARQVFGDFHPKTYQRMLSTASALQRLERFEEADQLFINAQQIAERLFPEGHPSLGQFIAERAVHFHDRGAFMKALAMYQKALDMAAKKGKMSENYAIRLNNLGYLYEDLGRYEEAVNMYRESIEIRQHLLGEDSFSVASARSNLARVLAKLDYLKEAETLSHQFMPVYSAHERDNFYNEVTLWVIKIKQSMDDNCQQVVKDMQPFLQRLANQSNKSWRRLGAEFWLAQSFYQCHRYDLAKTLSQSVLSLNDTIYLFDSYGHKLIKDKTEVMLKHTN
ncbi:serine/threonine-protein kinase [Marinicella gelatinilytica]|uniref:serine/threonine-protein kinase n=1 Tax=Marinicella gelatinilytica TaxID=2996017 RepID=UPI002260CD0D|nr:serine/threonine-protein kinase [Marinicella gelatinilytica]MCX7544394.1 serine/threonine-protein kinase [Marinicella gelatinilytica]